MSGHIFLDLPPLIPVDRTCGRAGDRDEGLSTSPGHWCAAGARGHKEFVRTPSSQHRRTGEARN